MARVSRHGLIFVCHWLCQCAGKCRVLSKKDTGRASGTQRFTNTEDRSIIIPRLSCSRLSPSVSSVSSVSSVVPSLLLPICMNLRNLWTLFRISSRQVGMPCVLGCAQRGGIQGKRRSTDFADSHRFGKKTREKRETECSRRHSPPLLPLSSFQSSLFCVLPCSLWINRLSPSVSCVYSVVPSLLLICVNLRNLWMLLRIFHGKSGCRVCQVVRDW